jgi:DNA-binding transcriptional LysR family regulator
MWLIPRRAFQRDNPGVTFSIDASDSTVDLDIADLDLACATQPRRTMCRMPIRLFGDQITPGCHPALVLLNSGPRLKENPDDLAQFSLIETVTHTRAHRLTSAGCAYASPKFQAKRWLQFNYAYQMVQAALTGQGGAGTFLAD